VPAAVFAESHLTTKAVRLNHLDVDACHADTPQPAAGVRLFYVAFLFEDINLK
jgi:hypothetical protein